MVGIRHKYILTFNLTLFQPGADYACHIGMYQPTFKPFLRAMVLPHQRNIGPRSKRRRTPR
jgi:hypothetical protein